MNLATILFGEILPDVRQWCSFHWSLLADRMLECLRFCWVSCQYLSGKGTANVYRIGRWLIDVIWRLTGHHYRDLLFMLTDELLSNFSRPCFSHCQLSFLPIAIYIYYVLSCLQFERLHHQTTIYLDSITNVFLAFLVGELTPNVVSGSSVPTIPSLFFTTFLKNCG